MATRSTIALEFADDTVQQVYCHWDGYLEHNGQILFDHYQDPFKLRDLIDLGDISSLAPSIEKPKGHSFNNSVDGYTVFYGRDRGDPGIEARKFANFEDYKARHQCQEYEYILRKDGNWYVSSYERPYVLLSEALGTVKEVV